MFSSGCEFKQGRKRKAITVVMTFRPKFDRFALAYQPTYVLQKYKKNDTLGDWKVNYLLILTVTASSNLLIKRFLLIDWNTILPGCLSFHHFETC
jgi:FAD synthase